MLRKAEDLVGQTIAGYRLLEILGKGGMSVVFLAQRVDTPQEQVAIKVLSPSNLITPEEFVSMQSRFLREAQAAYQLHHEHILPVLGYGTADGLFYMIMPVITGGTLASLLATRQEPLPLVEVAEYLNQLASAIDYAHEHGLIHRDIKPSNVLLDEQGKLYLVDFGIVRLFSNEPGAIDEAPTTLTTTGKIYGTPAYMAPERFRGEQAEPATDVYALGIVLYQLVTGRVPFKADTPLLLAMKQLNERPLSPRALRPDLPEPAAAAILQALAKQPADRFATASAFATAFNAGIKGQWIAGLRPLPPPPDAVPTLPVAPIVPIPEGPFRSNQAVFNPALASAKTEVLVAYKPTQVRVPSAMPPPSGAPQRRRWLLAAVVLAVIVLLALLLLPGIQQLYAPSRSTKQVPTPSPARVSTRTGAATPTIAGVTPPSPTAAIPSPSPAGATPTLPPQTTPTQGVTPTPTPDPTPSPTSSPTPTHKATHTPTPTP